ncbi:Alpha/Beta hydrolase protein [Favolaschia claudopus]|uniref:Alpha/Beta hydrolase protein n=1 Tax=Favolaschia claudopus TaxID=2862362 RepID=A0AAW0D6T7_9AGAR
MTVQTLAVDINGTVLAYTDSGKPASDVYITIFALHGMGFNGGIFKRLAAVAPKKNIRLVAINRRQYEGSTPFGPEAAIPITGSEDEKTKFLASRGIELANFAATFIEKNNLPPISADGKTGGVAFLGWSAGNNLTCAAVANIDGLSAGAQARLRSHLRAHIMYEAPSIVIGLPLPPDNWFPHMDKSMPAEKHTPMFTNWITSYFDHGDLATKDLKVLNYHLPSPYRRPSVYSMTREEFDAIVDMGPEEFAPLFMSQAQAAANLNKACFSETIKSLVPALKTTFIAGERSASYAIAAMWSLESENEARGGELKTVLIPGANHFYHWEEPEEALQVFVDAL